MTVTIDAETAQKRLEQALSEAPASFHDYYEKMRQSPNNLSWWFPLVKDCGIRVPKTRIFAFPKTLLWSFWNEQASIADARAVCFHWLDQCVLPTLKDFPSDLFIKNGSFSNKFDARTCRVQKDPYLLTHAVMELMFASLMVEAGGGTELVVRERIEVSSDVGEIYCGLPLVPETRVFYDFDTKRVIGSVNYWDYEVCSPGMHRYSDHIIYEAVAKSLEDAFQQTKDNAEKLVADHMANVEMPGQWSIDLMLAGEDVWLIDMALAKDSAYYDRFWPKEA